MGRILKCLRVFSQIVLFTKTKRSRLKEAKKVDQQKKDSVLFAFTLSVYLKEDSVVFLVHFSSDGASGLKLMQVNRHKAK